MVRERRDFYQVKKVLGQDPVPEAQLVEAEQAKAAADDAGKKRKRRAHKVRPGPETTPVDLEASTDADGAGGPELEIAPEVPGGASKKRTAREEVSLFLSSLFRLYRYVSVLKFVVVC